MPTYDSSVNENDIIWKTDSPFSVDTAWEFNDAYVEEGKLFIGSGGSVKKQISLDEGTKGEYAKLLTNLSSSNYNMTTENAKNVIMSIKLNYKEKESKRENFFPSYVFEDNFTKDYVVFPLTDDEVESIDVEIHNYEDEEICINSCGLYFSRTTEDIAEEAASDAYDAMKDYVDEALEHLDTDFIVPRVPDLAAMRALPMGAMRLVDSFTGTNVVQSIVDRTGFY